MPSMVWVKGELLSDLDAGGLDPTGQLDRAAQPSLFDRLDWFRLVLRHGGGTPLLARAASEGALAWLFLRRFGDKAKSIANWYSFSFGPVFAGQPDESRKSAMLVAIARRLRSVRPRLSTLRLDPVRDDDQDMLTAALRRAGWLVFAKQRSSSWTATTAGLSFAEYWAARPGEVRSTFKRKAAKVDHRVRICTAFEEDCWAAYKQVYEHSWKPEEGAPALLRELAEAEGAAGTLRLGILYIEERPVAAQFWTVERGRALIHKLAYRDDAREHSPGTLLSEAMFRHAIDVDKVETIDFGIGDDGYKAAWMDHRAPLWRIEAFNPRTATGLAGALRRRLSRLVRRGDSG